MSNAFADAIRRSPRRAIVAVFALAVIASGAIWWATKGASQQEIERATVHIQLLGVDDANLGFGSGSIIRKDGLILTNAHVAVPTAPGLPRLYGYRYRSDVRKLVVSLFVAEDEPAEPMYTARVVAVDGYLDVAVLQIWRTVDGDPVDPRTLDLPTVNLGDSDSLENDEDLRLVGYPDVGGGAYRLINSSRGSVSGFLPDPDLEARRGWIKTSASIYGGNSGGLAVNERGRLIGIPSRAQFEKEYLGTATDISGTLALIRPINIARPVIDAAMSGKPWQSPYLVKGGGKETFTLAGWATEGPSNGECGYTSDRSFPQRPAALYAIFDARNMKVNEDLQYVWRLPSDAGAAGGNAFTEAVVWKDESGASDCASAPSPGVARAADGLLLDGLYVVEVRVGPALRLVGRAETIVGRSSTGPAPEPNPDEFPNSDEEVVLGTLPQGLSSTCTREANDDLFEGASAGVRCSAPDGVTVYYDVFRLRDSLERAYWDLFSNVEDQGGARDDNGCTRGSVGEGPYTIRGEAAKAGGRLLCFRTSNGDAVFGWTKPRSLILGYAVGSKARPVYRWWSASGG
jgi:S1-C subfamily serine protease